MVIATIAKIHVMGMNQIQRCLSMFAWSKKRPIVMREPTVNITISASGKMMPVIIIARTNSAFQNLTLFGVSLQPSLMSLVIRLNIAFMVMIVNLVSTAELGSSFECLELLRTLRFAY